MAKIERLTITLPAEMTVLVRGAVDEGDYASSSEVVREALRRLEDQARAAAARARGPEGGDRSWPRRSGRRPGAGVRRPAHHRPWEDAYPPAARAPADRDCRADLVEIWATLAVEASETIASRSLLALQRAFEPLRQHPELGPAREQLGAGLRVTFQSSYAIYYRILDEAVVIVRVLHGARDVAALAERGGLA